MISIIQTSECVSLKMDFVFHEAMLTVANGCSKMGEKANFHETHCSFSLCKELSHLKEKRADATH